MDDGTRYTATIQFNIEYNPEIFVKLPRFDLGLEAWRPKKERDEVTTAYRKFSCSQFGSDSVKCTSCDSGSTAHSVCAKQIDYGNGDPSPR